LVLEVLVEFGVPEGECDEVKLPIGLWTSLYTFAFDAELFMV
jgi:hypothetical protein